MSVCRYSKEYTASSYTSLDNLFIYEYLPEATGNAVKVYTYGLFLCQNQDFDIELKTMAENLKISESEIIDAFTYWEEFELVNIISKDPFTVTYLPLRQVGNKPRKFKPEKYSGFTASVQEIIPSRMISTNEYSEYFYVMEHYGIKPEAMLMIVKYCVDIKGNDVGYRYILAVAKDFGARKILTAEQVEKELSSYILRTAEIEKILSAMNIKRKPEIDDLNLLNKWTRELNYEVDAIVFAASKVKKGGIQKLDKFILELYSLKCFTQQEIAEYSKNKKNLFDITLNINKALGIYIEVIDTVIDNYTLKWISYGYDEKALLLVANYCFKKNKKELQSMDEFIESLYKNGYISYDAIAEFFITVTENDKFISEMLSVMGVTRKPTNWDRENLKLWRSWNFSDEMIMEAVRLSSDKKSPIAYTGSILGAWKNKGIFNPSQIEKISPTAKSKNTFSDQRKYSESEMQDLLDNLIDIEF